MKICVLGAGVIGLTTAWCLAEAGHDVVIIDRHASTGKDASAANGAQLSYAFVAPLASPATLKKLPALLLSPDAPMRIRAGLDPALISWGIRFLLACRPGAVRETVAAQLALAALSRRELTRLTQSLGLSFGLRTAGKLVIYRSAREFKTAFRSVVATGKQHDQQVLTAAECLALEPALQLDAGQLAGGIFTASEQVGDCAAFCAALTIRLRQRSNVEWLLDTPIIGPIRSGGRLVAIDTGKGQVQADHFVLCMGATSGAFARACGFYLPIYPLKGYSITLTPPAGARILRHSVTDMARKLVFAPLARDGRPAVRIAGIADLERNDMTLDGQRVDILRRAAAELLGIDAAGDIAPWCGLRPTTPDSRPIIGWSPLDGLFINSGHGMLGWTLACGSARLTADMIERKRSTSETSAFALRRAA
ncbi:FAD-dependent oxidoreductase [Bradyrhizobium sp. WSM 1738]|uniref:FAD-dependent oxidoreductase n=1 Tax=Bradyrhizobium hereditatis TaxID=2821405 RepID=UPI001CE2BECB|nr:FAD-dependent oxidoreductase [Bradyrhizobium hereditatis]MCA6119936.1 FAD-dependent oxidoreductase [Bradyrhizobium hereditatis]